MTDTPHRIWVDPGAWEIVQAKTKVDPDYDLPYILDDPAALAASPTVQRLLREAEARGMERAAEIARIRAEQHADMALNGLPEQARLREAMEAAFTDMRWAFRTAAAALRKGGEG